MNDNNQRLLKARKKVKTLKDFYIHCIIMLLAIPIVITVNLVLTPEFHWFWIAIWAFLFSICMHWLGNIRFGKDWEDQKIKELIKKYKNTTK